MADDGGTPPRTWSLAHSELRQSATPAPDASLGQHGRGGRLTRMCCALTCSCQIHRIADRTGASDQADEGTASYFGLNTNSPATTIPRDPPSGDSISLLNDFEFVELEDGEDDETTDGARALAMSAAPMTLLFSCSQW